VNKIKGDLVLKKDRWKCPCCDEKYDTEKEMIECREEDMV